MKKQQSGFTLIELVIVIVILGILAAVAVPKFIDLKGDAATAAVQGVAGGLAAASAINKAGRLVSTLNGITITACASAGGLLDGGLDAKYSLGAGSAAGGATTSCTVSSVADTTKTASFTLHAMT